MLMPRYLKYSSAGPPVTGALPFPSSEAQGSGTSNLVERWGWTSLQRWGRSSSSSAALDLPSPEPPCWCCRTDTVVLHHPQTPLPPVLPWQPSRAPPWGRAAVPAPAAAVRGAEGARQASEDEDAGEQVGAAAGEQSQTAGRWMEQQGGNTRRAAGGEGSGRATPLCTQLDINYTCWNPARLLRPFFRR